MALLFWMAIALILYVYLGYFGIIYMMTLVYRKPVRKAANRPFVSILIAAYNEEQNIETTVLNKLALDYPADKFEVIVISDASTDRTDAIVQSISSPRVRHIRQATRSGKTSALLLGRDMAQGDIIVFSDANSIYAPDAISIIVDNFSDPAVGYVSGRMVYANPETLDHGDGSGLYMRYENALRAAETRIGSIVGVDGGIDAIRKTLFLPMRPDQLPDFVLPMNVVDKGYRVVYEPDALLYEDSLTSLRDEYRMRVRVSLRAFWALWDMRHLLSFRKNPMFAWQLWSHKVLRYTAFIFFICAYLSNLMLIDDAILYLAAFAFQNLCYGSALIYPLLKKQGYNYKPMYFLHYFAILNTAAAHAFIKFLAGQKQIIWTPRKG
jgi:cellulose synthase/poly-beta-1,6-N-acetylglucosamine synthase-like glycosyltransferase